MKPLYQTNSTLYNTAKRLGLSRVMDFLENKPQYEARLKVLYQFRCQGYSVLFQNRKILVNGVEFSAEDLDNPDLVREKVE